MMLPTEKTPKKQGFQDLVILVYGPPKIGKSTFCSHFDNALFLATEAGLNHLEVSQVPIASWVEFKNACTELQKDGHGFETVIIDTIDNLYKLCADHVIEKHNVEHVSDIPGYAKGWALLNNEFHRVLTRLARLPLCLVFVSHAQTIEIPCRTGKYEKTVPSIPKSARKFVLGMTDLILYQNVVLVKDGKGKLQSKRVISTVPCREHEAGDRTGKLPPELPLDFKIFQAAFDAKTEERTNV